MLTRCYCQSLLAIQLDVCNAFLHGDLQEEVYIKPPDGVSVPNGMACKLNRTLYGLKQAPYAWNSKFSNFVMNHGFSQSPRDKCLYVKMNGDQKVYLLLYVDDIILASNSRDLLDEVRQLLMSHFSMKDLGQLHNFLGIKIERTADGMFLNQSLYFENVLRRFNMMNCKPVSTPLECKPPKSIEGECIVESKPYRQLVGCLMYGMLATRPDLSMAVNFFSRFLSCATNEQWNGLKRVLRYIKGSLKRSLFFPKNVSKYSIEGYADADFGGDSDFKSTSGYLLQLNKRTVLWATRKQDTVALSTCEAEYVSLATTACDLFWLENLLADFQIDLSTSVLYEDNQSCIEALKRADYKRLKHINVKLYFLKDLFEKENFLIQYIQSKDQLADILTKGLLCEAFIRCIRGIGLRDL